MGAIFRLQAPSAALDVLVRGRLGYAEVLSDLGVRMTERDQAGRLDFAPAQASRRQCVFDGWPERSNAAEETFAD
jgi:hypothetical protein